MEISPRKARSDQFGKLNSDSKHTKDYWILLNEDYITIAKQTSGDSCMQEMQIDKIQFNQLIDWYNRKQLIKQK